MKRVLTIINIADDPTGYVGEILEKHGITYDIIEAESQPIPDPTKYDAVVVFGGPQNANEDEKYPYFTQEKAALRTIVEQDIPVLGICLGGQMLATVLGGVVKKHDIMEIGFSEVQCTDEGKQDPLYKGLADGQMVYQWHEDTFDIPPGAVRLATSETTANQAFRYGRNAYGLQYHIELTPTMLDTWLREPFLEQKIIDAVGKSEYERIMNERAQYSLRYEEHTRVLFENFLHIAGLI